MVLILTEVGGSDGDYVRYDEWNDFYIHVMTRFIQKSMTITYMIIMQLV
jgi:hypothetical protein